MKESFFAFSLLAISSLSFVAGAEEPTQPVPSAEVPPGTALNATATSTTPTQLISGTGLTLGQLGGIAGGVVVIGAGIGIAANAGSSHGGGSTTTATSTSR